MYYGFSQYFLFESGPCTFLLLRQTPYVRLIIGIELLSYSSLDVVDTVKEAVASPPGRMYGIWFTSCTSLYEFAVGSKYCDMV